MYVETDDLRPLVELREGIGQDAIPVLGGVLVDQCRSGRGVTGPAHQFRQCGAGGGGPGQTGVAEIVEVQRHAYLPGGRPPYALGDVAPSEVAGSLRRGEEQRIGRRSDMQVLVTVRGAGRLTAQRVNPIQGMGQVQPTLTETDDGHLRLGPPKTKVVDLSDGGDRPLIGMLGETNATAVMLLDVVLLEPGEVDPARRARRALLLLPGQGRG